MISFSLTDQAHAQSSNLIGRGPAQSTESNPTQQNDTADNSLGSEPINLIQRTLPDWLSGIIGQTVLIQTKLNRKITATLRDAKNGNSFWPGLMIIALSFAYGVFHAAGPGHGKMITTTYFLSRDAGWKQGIAMGSLIAMVQAVSAIIMVGGLTLILNLGPAAITRNGLVMEAVSYGLIAVLGAVMGLRILQGRDDCCDHDGQSHGYSHQGHNHAPHHTHDHQDPALITNRWHMIATGLIVGLRPCTGSILILLFTLANGIFLIGIGAAFAMAVGVALTISLIGLAAIGIRTTGTQNLFGLSETSSGIVRRAVGLTGAATITLFGVMLLLASAQQLGWL